MLNAHRPRFTSWPLKPPLRGLPALLAVLAVATATTLQGSENTQSTVSLQRAGSGAITLQSPSHRPADPASSNSIALGPRLADTEGASPNSARSSAMPLVTIGSSLAVVLGLFAALVWVSKKTGPAAGRGGAIPEEALRLLGQKSLGTSGSIALIRCGRSVLVVGISTAGMQSLAEITDEEQVRNLEAICLGEGAASFQAALGELPPEPAGHGFASEQHIGPLARKKLFSDR